MTAANVVEETTPGTPEEQEFLGTVRAFSDYHLPCRGWSRVLEVGAGAGGLALGVLLAKRGHEVTVADVDEEALRRAQRHFAALELPATFVPAGGLGREGRSFDAITCFDPAAMGSSPREAAMELRQLLRHHGLLVVGPAFAAFDGRGLPGFKHGPAFPSGFSFRAVRSTAGIASSIGLRR
jgi:SAM-dependent methyltransferase